MNQPVGLREEHNMDNDQDFEETQGATRRDILKLSGLAALGSATAGALVTSGHAGASLKTAPLATTGDFQLANRFSFEIDGLRVPGVHTIDMESDASSPAVPPSPPTNTVTVTKDWSNTSEWYKWRKAVLDGKVDRRSVSVIFLNDHGKETSRMNFTNCSPSKWVGPSLNSKNSGHAQEKLEISWETFELKAG